MNLVLYYILLIISNHDPVESYVQYPELRNLYTTNFCDHKCGQKLNICCIYRGKYAVGDLCRGNMKLIILQDEHRHRIVDAMNAIRNATAAGDSTRSNLRGISASNMQILSYSKQLEYSATCWAKQCRLNHSRCRANEFGLIGETICWRRAPPNAVSTDFMEMCQNCPKHFLENHPNLRATTIDKLSFTSQGDDERNQETIQTIWAHTQYVGCAAASFPHIVKGTRVVLLVCHYSPAGNVMEKSVFHRGKPCSNCAFNGVCNSRYKNLCGNERAMESDLWIPPVSFAFAVKVSSLNVWRIVLVCFIFVNKA
ncbi:Cysteine-rich secretory protein family [Popillia japonica]|uniref:Cysteine-rich secretory protein family n=1 Tax=Popillia japonica TaxID=7064 RepID=A0AAW1HTB8_POPJA